MLTQVAMAVAMITLPLAMMSSWVVAFVGDDDRYVSTVAPLATDPVVKKAAVTYIERETFSVLENSDEFPALLKSLDLSCLGIDSSALGGFADLINSFLGPQLMTQIEPLIRPGIHAAVVQAVASPAFAQVWVTANRTAHGQVVAALDGRDPQPGTDVDAILIPLQQAVQLFTGDLPCKNLIPADALGQIAPALTLVDADDLSGAHAAYEVLHGVGYWLVPVFVLALALAVATARPRRRAIWQLGAGFLAGLGLLEAVLALAKSRISASGADNDVFDAIWGAITHDLQIAVLVVAVASALALAGGLLAGRRSGADRVDDAR